MTGHTHEAYDCVIDGRPVTSAGAYGRVLTDVDLTLDGRTGEVTRVRTDNVVVDRRVPRDARQVALLDRYRRIVAPLGERVVADVPARLDRDALAGAVASAHLEATRSAAGAELALANPSGVRAELDGGPVSYAELFAVQPFGLHLVTLTLTGEQLRRALAGPKALAISAGFDTTTVEPRDTYRVTVSSFLAEGGDGFAVFREGTERTRGVNDVEALQSYLGGLTPG